MKPVAIITGAGRGIGRAVAGQLSKAFDCVLVSRTPAELEETARQFGGWVCPGDVTDAGEVANLIQRVRDRYGRIDALVHCAGLAPMCDVDEMSIEQWHAVIDTNLSSAFYLIRQIWPIWKKQASGVAVFISSQAARDPFGGSSAYAAAKAGINLFGLALAREGSMHGIRVHTIAPGATETQMLRKILPETIVSPAKTMHPDDVAKVVAQCVVGDLTLTSGEAIYLRIL